MVYRMVFVPEVCSDIQQTIDYFNDLQKGLGNRFFFSVKLSYSLLQSEPFRNAIKYDDLYCLTVSDIPYHIIYRIDSDSHTIVVFAVYHTSRETITTDIIQKRTP